MSSKQMIDAEFEPAKAAAPSGRSIGLTTALSLSALAALGGGAIGATAPRVAPSALDLVAPNELSQVRREQALAAQALQNLDGRLDAAATQAELAKVGQRVAAMEAVPTDPESLSPAGLARTVAALNGRINQLEAALAAESAANARQLAGLNIPELRQQVASLEANLARLSQRVDSAATKLELQAMGIGLAELQNRFASVEAEAMNAGRAARASYAIAAASDAARQSGPFPGAFSALSAALPNDANVQAIASIAASGAPSFADLAVEFATVEVDLLRAARSKESGGGFWGGVQSTLSRFVVVRKVSDDNLSPTDHISRAAAFLRQGDLQRAHDEVAALEGEPAKLAAPWLTKAKVRLELDGRLAAIRADLAKQRS